jgi:hypothetical protein
MMIDLSISSNRTVVRATGAASGEDLVALRALLRERLRDNPVLVLDTVGLSARGVPSSTPSPSNPDLPDVVLSSVRRARLLGGGIAVVCDPPLRHVLADRATNCPVLCYPDSETAVAAISEARTEAKHETRADGDRPARRRRT